jgi:diguanylate cyclase (GGDEF)-like protein
MGPLSLRALLNPALARPFIPFLIPGALLLAAAASLHSGLASDDAAKVIDFYWYAVLGAGSLLAWRFQSSRIFMGLLLLLAADAGLRALVTTGDNSLAAGAIALAFAINLGAAGLMLETRFSFLALLPKVAALFIQSVGVAILCRPGTLAPDGALAAALTPAAGSWLKIPATATVAFLVALGICAVRFFLYRKPADSGLFWSGAALVLALHATSPATARAYIATGALALVLALIETSYQLAYHDELTGLPGRRAFNRAAERQEDEYAIAMVDVDHFKNFNDAFGHEIGDEVLRMVARRLEQVSGGGVAYRCGGEEFAILFPGKSAEDALPHVERLRAAIEQSTFIVRGRQRRTRSRLSHDRRKPRPRARVLSLEPQEVSVTVSAGVADTLGGADELDDVLRAADRALYCAKEAGRNRVALAPRGAQPIEMPKRREAGSLVER